MFLSDVESVYYTLLVWMACMGMGIELFGYASDSKS